jgi:histidinol-phosphate aminotransferase
MSHCLTRTNRYHDEEMDQLGALIARQENLQPDQILIGCGSSEVLHCAVDAFTSPARPLITTLPSYELPVDMTTALGNPVLKLPMTASWAADVKKMAEAADKAKGGLIYLVNPNNPTSSITPKDDIAWLVNNLPANTVALIDEAYIHFSTAPDLASAVPYVRDNKNVIVARTFSKIYGMAGLRVGFTCARADITAKLAVFRNNTISLTGVVAAKAALETPKLVSERREKMGRVRADVCSWLDAHGLSFIPPHANFLMINVKRDVRSVITAMLEKGVAVGRPFPPLDQMLRVTIGSEEDMSRFKQAFGQVMGV